LEPWTTRSWADDIIGDTLRNICRQPHPLRGPAQHATAPLPGLTVHQLGLPGARGDGGRGAPPWSACVETGTVEPRSNIAAKMGRSLSRPASPAGRRQSRSRLRGTRRLTKRSGPFTPVERVTRKTYCQKQQAERNRQRVVDHGVIHSRSFRSATAATASASPVGKIALLDAQHGI
jgi:hypothetical protein